MLTTLRNRNFALVWSAGLISIIGDYMLFVALPIYIYQVTQSTLATGAMFIAGTLPRLLFGPIAGVFVDRWNRKRIMVVTNLLLGLGLLPLLLVRSVEFIWIVYLVQLFEATIAQLFAPAEGALLPTLVGKENLIAANALNSLNSNLARLIGPAVGAFVVGVFHLSGVVVLDIATFWIAALLIALIDIQREQKAQTSQETRSLPEMMLGVWRDWLQGLRMIRQENTLALLFLIATIPRVGEGIFATLLVPFVSKVLSGSELDYGYVLSAQAIGGLVGSVIIGYVAHRAPLYRIMGIGALLLGLIDLVIFNYSAILPGVAPAIILMAIVGVPAVGYGMSLNTMLQLVTTDEFRGRVLATFGTTGALLGLIGMILAGSLGERISVVSILNIQGFGYVVVGVLALMLFGRMYRTHSLSAPQQANIVSSSENL